ncbi:phage tail protein [Flavobacterium beibuense]|uniref:Tail Collar domain protein n=1 Tax=Flavobacterium beibuense TaxID=657326 RepID=A0A444WG53_9FLAO|nr:tail fiber protein [Flavobacterium beibuense]RYJ44799.1 Tail Collar domain protein [Flavobacterium beibuense]
MEDQYLGTILLFAGNFLPANFKYCNGDLLPISENQALFSIIGSYYGGDGRTTFALPDLRGTVPIGAGAKPGHASYVLGQAAGSETNTILTSNMPPHNHTVQVAVNNTAANVSTPVIGSTIAAPGTPSGRGSSPTYGYINADPNTPLNGKTAICGNTGSGIPLNNMQPYQAINYIICVNGLYPSRS